MYSAREFWNVRPALLEPSAASAVPGAGSRHQETEREIQKTPQPLVLVIDADISECECLAGALGVRCPEFRVVAHLSDSFVRSDLRPDVLLVGLQSVDLSTDGLAATIRSIQSAFAEVPIVVLAEDIPEMPRPDALMALGVSGCHYYSVGIEGLTKILWLVLHGGVCFPRDTIARPCEVRKSGDDPDADPVPRSEGVGIPRATPCDLGLTCREHDVVQLLRKGKANKIIAYELGISISTVKVHVRNIMRKTGATNRVEAALLPRIHGDIHQNVHQLR